jgi:hypothetical protein
MYPKTNRDRPEQPRPAEQPKADVKKRFRIEKIEERIAPKSGKKYWGSSTDQAFNSIY